MKSKAGERVLVSGQSRRERLAMVEGIATQADRSLYKVNLARVVSNFIGETEENLARVFAVAAATDAVLFFDEADALFGKRTQVKDGHDRFADQVTGFLMALLETHPGMVVLATSNRKNLDDAFLRRLRFTSARSSK